MSKARIYARNLTANWIGYGANPATGLSVSRIAAVFAIATWTMAAPVDAESIRVLITVDVESYSAGNPEKDIWCRGDGREHGIGRMMDIMDSHGVKGTFFVNVYEAAEHGYDRLAEVCRVIHRRGHDVELHTHPRPMFGVGLMHEADLATQTRILKRGRDLIRQWIGQDVVAHRAGGYAADLNTIKACKAAGILLEFSLNVASPRCALGTSGLSENAPIVKDDVLCVPVTAYVQASAGSWRSMRFLDIESSSLAEIKKVIADLIAHDVRTAVIMMHSFSFQRTGGRGGERAEGTLVELLGDLTADPGVKVVSARELYHLWRTDREALEGNDYLPETGWWMTYCRAWQRLGEGWKNVAVAFAPPGAIVLGCVTGAVWLHRRRRRIKRAPA